MKGFGSRLIALLCGLLLSVSILHAAYAEEKPPIAPPTFSPTGIHYDVLQVRARFEEPMVALGDPRVEGPPFEIDCEPGSQRWIDERTWAYEFAETLPGGIACDFVTREGLRTLEGRPVPAGVRFALSTGGPRILSSSPSQSQWGTIDEDEIFILHLSTSADPRSVEKHAFFRIGGIVERVGVDLLEGEERDRILFLSRVAPSPSVVVLRARRNFPSGAGVELVWPAEIETPGGMPGEHTKSLGFTTRNAFSATLFCPRLSEKAACLPERRIRVDFSAGVYRKLTEAVRLRDPDSGILRSPSEVRWARIYFEGPFPPGRRLEIVLPDDFRDEAGRPLANAAAFPLPVEIAPWPPLAKFAAGFGLLEAASDPALPITVRGLGSPDGDGKDAVLSGSVGRVTNDGILPWLRRVSTARRDKPILKGDTVSGLEAPPRPLTIPLPDDPEQTEVLGIPLEEPGLYIVEVESRPLGSVLLEKDKLGKDKPMYVSAAALVTNLAVHLKHGQSDSLAWVTTLDRAEPVPGAEVLAYDCAGVERASATTDAEGIARFEDLPAPEDLPNCYSDPYRYDPWRGYRGEKSALGGAYQGLLVVARKGEDTSFTLSSWDEGIEPFRFGFSSSWERPATFHTIFDRSLVRAGETIHMKHVARYRTVDGFAVPPAHELPTGVSIRHRGTGKSVDLPIEWTNNGTALTTWTIGRGAKLGTYTVSLTPAQRSSTGSEPTPTPPEGIAVYERHSSMPGGISGSFEVQEFRIPLLQATVGLPTVAQVAPSEIPVEIALRYLAGGGVGDTPVVLRTLVRPGGIDLPRDFADWTFGNGRVETGAGATTRDPGSPETKVRTRQTVELDAEGTARATVVDIPEVAGPSTFVAELEYRDVNGEIQTSNAEVPLWPATRVPGIEVGNWTGASGKLEIQTAVIDTAGAPVADTEVVVTSYQKRNFTTRKRVAGGFYSYDTTRETSFLHTLCRGRTDERGRFTCHRKAPAKGELLIQASIEDPDGREASAHTRVWVSGDEELWHTPSDTDRMELVPERKHWEPGETARFQVRMPFERARALITVEREGVLDARVVELKRSDGPLEIPVTDAMAPNVYISVLAVRGRVSQPQPTALVDLGRPAFRMGLTEILVGWREHDLEVRVQPERTTYRPREVAMVDVEVLAPGGGPPPEGTEIALAAVDVGLLQLAPNRSWRLLQAMMQRRAEDVFTSTGIAQVVGKRHFGRKARPEGGGGGVGSTRELFDTLLTWQGRVVLDAEGKARVEVPLNDSLTSFRIVAIANGATGLFGTGRATIRSTKELMLFSGLPPLVRTGDEILSEFTVRNASERAMDIRVQASVEGLEQPLEPQDLRLAAGEAQSISWSILAPQREGELRWNVLAREVRGSIEDRLATTQKVSPVDPVRTLQASLMLWRPPGPTSVEVAVPDGAPTDRGGVRVTLSPTLAGSLVGVRRWMEDYPHRCLEQKVSRAIAIGDDELWRRVTENLDPHVSPSGLLRFFPRGKGDAVLTAYVLDVTHAAGRLLPTEFRENAIDSLRRYVQGRIAGDNDDGALYLRKITAVAALARIGRADPSMVDGLPSDTASWPTTSVLDWWSILQALPEIPGSEEKRAEAEGILLGRLFEQGSTTTLREGSTGTPWGLWLLASDQTDTLRLIHFLVQSGAWPDELPKLVRGAIGMQTQARWSTTVANAWGTVAISRFIEAYEPEPVGGSTLVALEGRAQQVDWIGQPGGGALSFPWPPAQSPLTVQHEGPGQPWILTRLDAALPLTEPIWSGFQIERTVTPAAPHPDGKLRVGDILDVQVTIQSATRQGWVALTDPIPPGASFLSPVGEDVSRGWSPTFEEKRFEGLLAYWGYVPSGKISTGYRIRLNHSGLFHLPPTRVEALYVPEAFGVLPGEVLRVE